MHLSAPNLWEQIHQSRTVYAGKMFQIGSSVVCQVKTIATVPETQVSAAVIKHCSLAHSGEGLFQLSAYCETQAGRSSRGCGRTEAQSMDKHRLSPQDCSAHSLRPPRPICRKATQPTVGGTHTVVLNPENGS